MRDRGTYRCTLNQQCGSVVARLAGCARMGRFEVFSSIRRRYGRGDTAGPHRSTVGRYGRLLTAGSLAVGIVLSLTVTPALAGPVSSNAPSARQKAVALAAAQRMANGTASTADKKLIAGIPELARSVPDPSKTTVTVSSSPVASLSQGRSGAATLADEPGWNGCANYFVWVQTRSALGAIIWRWQYVVGVCYYFDDYLSRWADRFDTLLYQDGTVEVMELTTNWAQGNFPRRTASTRMQRHLRQCVLSYGCWGNAYPWIQMDITIASPMPYMNYTWGVA
jgi:hypothetical protein